MYTYLPDFLGVQIQSFCSFLQEGLQDELESSELKFGRPQSSAADCMNQSNTYECELYVRPNHERPYVQLAKIPMMTDQGLFVIHGVRRIITNQLVRSAGMYSSMQVRAHNQRTYTISYVCEKGVWIRLETDRFSNIWVRINNYEKIPIFVFLRALGITDDIVRAHIHPSVWLCLRTGDPKNRKTALKYLGWIFRKGKNGLSVKHTRSFVHSSLFNPESYDFTQAGRLHINKKTGNTTTVRTLTPEDILCGLQSLLELEAGSLNVDSIDHLNNKRVRLVREVLQKQVHRALCARQSLTTVLRHFFGFSPLSQFMDQTNPLGEVTQKRRLTSLGPGGVSREAGLAVRDIHPTHYARICPIETPEGKNAGLVNSLSSHAHVDVNGFIESTYLARSTHAYRLRAEQEERFYVSTESGLTQTKHTLCRFNTSIVSVPTSSVDFWFSSSVSMISVASSLIPFVEHDDGNRALMGSNMQRQAVHLMHTECAIVGTGMESSVAKYSRQCVNTQISGVVTYTDCEKIQVCGNTLHTYTLANDSDLTFSNLASFDAVRAGDTLGCTQIQNGEVSLGKNMMVAYLVWEGYNFEDAIVVSQSTVSKHMLTSCHLQKIQISCNDEPTQYSIVQPGKWVSQGDLLACSHANRSSTQSVTPPVETLVHDVFRSNTASVTPAGICWTRQCREQQTNKHYLTQDIQGRVVQTFVFADTKLIFIYVVVHRPIQIGDKIAGRHGNKGIISNILPEDCMPYVSDGTQIDVVFNPLGVPSRMNVGQLYECILGIAGWYLCENYRIKPFNSHPVSSSRSLVFTKLRQASTYNTWLFHPSHPGKTRVFDGRSGDLYDHPVTVGVSYILKLVHLVDSKIHARSTGGYSLITQQPLKGKSKSGGQRVGEMEVWAFEAFGAGYTLQEMMTIKSDCIEARNMGFRNIVQNKPVKQGSLPESFRVLAYEIRALCFDIHASL
jgi:DNA-directed RNA polymerase subunit beta